MIIPELWQKADEWKATLEEAEGAQRRCVLVQLRGVNLLKSIPESVATPERMGWMTLWTRVFTLLEGARGALERNAGFTIDVLARGAFETALYTQAILEPVVALHELERRGPGRTRITEQARHNTWQEVMDRMRAYAAWCLWSDLQFCDEFAHPKTQEGIWDPDPARSIASDAADLRAFEAFYGPLDLRNEHELERDQQQQLAALTAKRDRLKAWLSDSRLTSWVAKLKFSREALGPQSFFSLLFKDQATVASRLRSLQQRFAYFRYLRGSLLIHGSTADEMLLVGKDVLSPAFTSDAEEAGRSAYDVASSCNLVLLCLFLMQKHIWPTEPSVP